MDPDDRDPIDFDHHSAAWVDDPYPLYAELREEHPLAWSEAHGGFWLLSRYRDVRSALLDWETFSSAHPGRIAIPHTNPGPTPGIPIETDPPRHSAYRAAVADLFARAQVERFEPELTARAHALIDAFGDRASVELVGAYATPLMARAIQLMFALSDDEIARIEGWSEAVFGRRLIDPEGATRAHAELAAYLRGALAARRAQPRDDLFTRLVQLEVEGRALTEDEQVGYARVLLLAGREATIDAIANSLAQLAAHPEQRRALAADPSLMRGAVEELLRYHAPIQLLGRVATRDVALHGRTIRAGESVAMLYGCANRDDEAFEGAGECRLDRRRNPHLAFGGGPHYCLGAHLARLAVRVALAAMLERSPEFALFEGGAVERKANGDARGFRVLEVGLG